MLKCMLTAITLLLWAEIAPAQLPSVAPPPGLVVEGVPEIPPSLGPDVLRYSNFRSARRESWHPVRREMLITTTFGSIEQVHLIRTPGGARTQLTFGSEPPRIPIYQPTHGNYFLFFKDVGGNERFQMYRYDFASGAVHLITDGQSRNTAGGWSHSGALFAFRSNRRTGKDMDIYVMNPTDSLSARLVTTVTGSAWRVVDWSPDDRSLLLIQRLSDTETRLWIADVANGEKKPFQPDAITSAASYEIAKYSRDGRGLFLMTDAGSDFQRLFYADIATTRTRELLGKARWDVEQFDLSPDGSTIAYTTNEDGASVLHLIDASSGIQKPVGRVPVGIIRDLEWHRNGRELGFTFESTRSPGDVYSLDVTSGHLERWTFSEMGGLNLDNLPEPEIVRWKSFDGREISGVLYRPPRTFTGPRPVMVRIHGGPRAQSRPEFLGRLSYYVNELGVALLFPNVRGSSGYGRTFLSLDNGLRREGAYRDMGTMLDWIATRRDLDSLRVMVTGTSYGGHMALVSAARYADRICCAIDVVGMGNLVSFVEKSDQDAGELRAEYGDILDPATRSLLEKMAPLNLSKGITKPLLVVAGANDPRVPLSESEAMVAAVKKNGTPVWYLLAKDEGHGFERRPNTDFQILATIAFIRQYLLR